MDATNGLHAILTFLAGVLLTYFGWTFSYPFLQSTTAEPLHSILWAAYITATLLITIVAPVMIASSDENQTSIVDALKSYGFSLIAIIISRVAYPIIETFNDWIPTTYGKAVFGFGILFLGILALFVVPIIMVVWPEMEETAAKAVGIKGDE